MVQFDISIITFSNKHAISVAKSPTGPLILLTRFRVNIFRIDNQVHKWNFPNFQADKGKENASSRTCKY